MSSQITKVIDLVPGRIESLRSVFASELHPDTFWAGFVCEQQPVLVKGAAAHWPAVRSWSSIPYLKSLTDDEQVMYSHMFNALPMRPLWRSAFKRESLGKCLDDLQNSQSDDVYSMPAMPVPRSWQNDLGNYTFLSQSFDLPPRVYPEKRLFMYRRASTEWHYHNADETLTTQIVGQKRVSLFCPAPGDWSIYAELLEANFHHMPIGCSLFPDSSPLTKYECLLDAGDALYIPPFWWHAIEPSDDHIGITLAYCFRSPTFGPSDGRISKSRRDAVHS